MAFTNWKYVGGGNSSPTANRIECGFYWQVEQDLALNTSRLRLRPTLKRIGSCTTFNHDAQNSYFNIDGTQHTIATRFDCPNMSLNTIYPLVTAQSSSGVFYTTTGNIYIETVIEHDADGSKTINITERILGDSSSSVFRYSQLATTLELPTINRIELSDTTIGQETNITIPFATETDVTTLSYSFEGHAGNIGTVTGQSLAWIIPASLAQHIPTAKTGTLTITAVLNGNTYTSQMEIKVDDSLPVITDASIEVSPASGTMVQGFTTISLTAQSMTHNYADVYPYMKINGREYIGLQSCASAAKVISASRLTGDGLVEYGVIDARGVKNTLTSQLSVIEYEPITIGAVEGAWNTDTNELDLTISGMVYKGSIGSLSRYVNVSCGGVSVEQAVSGSGYEAYTLHMVLTGYTSDQSLNLEISGTDGISTITFQVTIPKAIPLITYTENYFNVNGEIRQNGSAIGSGLSLTNLYSGSTTTGTVTLVGAYPLYKMYIAMIKVKSSDIGYLTYVVPAEQISSTSNGWSCTASDEANYDSRYWYHTGDDVKVALRARSSTGTIYKIWGVK